MVHLNELARHNTAIWFNNQSYTSRLLSGEWTADLEWHHVALVRHGSSWMLFLDGVLLTTAINATAMYATTPAIIGRCEPTGEANGWFNGWLNDYRITRGTARYIADFVPPIRNLPTGVD